ncbi:MAG: hypothetical protein IT531_14180 [Burkholderiales bacterium]|nr:hypothetical protein [Burkholderiales bacterium]
MVADIGLARDTGVLNANPAGLTGVGWCADVYFTAAHAIDIAHAGLLGNDRGGHHS